MVQPADGLERAAAAVRDHRGAGGLRLDRCDAEVLLGGDQERRRGGDLRGRRAVVEASGERHVGRQRGGKARALRPVADDDQRPVRQFTERVDDDVDPLVRHEARHRRRRVSARIAVAGGGGRGEALDVDRRIDDVGVAAPGIADRAGDVVRIGDEAVDPCGRRAVPGAEARERPIDQRPGPAGAAGGFAGIGRVHRPRETRRRVAVADVGLPGPRARALGDACESDTTRSYDDRSNRSITCGHSTAA